MVGVVVVNVGAGGATADPGSWTAFTPAGTRWPGLGPAPPPTRTATASPRRGRSTQTRAGRPGWRRRGVRAPRRRWRRTSATSGAATGVAQPLDGFRRGPAHGDLRPGRAPAADVRLRRLGQPAEPHGLGEGGAGAAHAPRPIGDVESFLESLWSIRPVPILKRRGVEYDISAPDGVPIQCWCELATEPSRAEDCLSAWPRRTRCSGAPARGRSCCTGTRSRRKCDSAAPRVWSGATRPRVFRASIGSPWFGILGG